jgi:hypothetical protein
MQELAGQKYRALQAIMYGAMVAGGSDITWDEFDAKFKTTSLGGFAELIQQATLDTMPEDDGKNPEATPT